MLPYLDGNTLVPASSHTNTKAGHRPLLTLVFFFTLALVLAGVVGKKAWMYLNYTTISILHIPIHRSVWFIFLSRHVSTTHSLQPEESQAGVVVTCLSADSWRPGRPTWSSRTSTPPVVSQVCDSVGALLIPVKSCGLPDLHSLPYLALVSDAHWALTSAFSMCLLSLL